MNYFPPILFYYSKILSRFWPTTMATDHQEEMYSHLQQPIPHPFPSLSDPGTSSQTVDNYEPPPTLQTRNFHGKQDTGKYRRNKFDLGHSYHTPSSSVANQQESRGAPAGMDKDGYLVPQNIADKYDPRFSEYHVYDYTL